MKRLLISCVALLSSLLCATANAEMYLGLDAGASLSKHKQQQKSANHVSYVTNIYTGFKVADYTFIELGSFLDVCPNKSKTLRSGSTRMKGLHAGVVFDIPVVERLSFLPGVSVAYLERHAYKPKSYDSRKDLFAPRVMGALQYKLADNVNLRGYTAWHHVRATCGNKMRMHDNFHFGVGLNYSFDLI